MRRRRILVATTFLVVALVAFASGTAVVVASQSHGEVALTASRAPAQTLSIVCPSPALGGGLPAEVYLPAGYSRRASRYPVIYFLHGLPADPTTYTGYGFVAGALAGARQRAIVVAPQGARSQNSDREYLDWSTHEDWPRAIDHDLPTCIDSRFHTIRDRFGRALAGLSAGGYGAFNIGLRSLQTFGAVESWSGYFVATDPSGLHILSLGSTQSDNAAMVPRGPALIRELGTWPSMIAFFVGRQDSRFYSMNEQFHQSLSASGITHRFQVYAGGHAEALWRSQAPRWLGLALAYLAAGQRRRDKSGGAGLGSG